MTRLELYALAEANGHQVLLQAFSGLDAVSAEIGGTCFIGLRPDLPENEETELLAHELGHCEYAGFYSILTPLNTRGRVECRARKWAFLRLVPLGELRRALRGGITAPWELADHFGVSEPFLYAACAYYQNACGCILEAEIV